MNLQWVAGDKGVERLLHLRDLFYAKKTMRMGLRNFDISKNDVYWLFFCDEEGSQALHKEYKRLNKKSGVHVFIDDYQVLSILDLKLQNFLSHDDNNYPMLDLRPSLCRPWSLKVFEDTNNFINLFSPWVKELYAKLIFGFLPADCESGNVEKTQFASSRHDTKGFVYLALAKPDYYPIWKTSIDFLHELGHQVLMYYLLCDPIIISDPEIKVYSGARRTLRPSYRALHSAVALSYMLLACKEIRKISNDKIVEIPNSEFTIYAHELKLALIDNLDSLREKCEFSEFGKNFLQDFDEIIASFI